MSDELIRRLQDTSAIDQPMEARRLMDASVVALKAAHKDRQIVAALQKALAYWMPDVTDDRSAADAMLLCGYEGPQEPSWGQQRVDEIARLTADLEAPRTLPEEPTIAMLEALANRPWDCCGNGMQDEIRATYRRVRKAILGRAVPSASDGA